MYIVGILRWPGGTVLAKRRNPTHADAHTSFVNILHWCDFALCNLLHKNIRLGCRNLRRHSQLQTRWTHIFFFFLLFPCLLFSSRFPCLVVSLSACPHMSAKELFSMFVSVDLCWSATKHMTGKSLCEMRGCVYISTQMFCYLSLCITPLWTATSSEHREWSGLFLG